MVGRVTVDAQESGRIWVAYQGDCVEVIAGLPPDSIDLSVYSPPFMALYTYTASERDLGNCSGRDEFIAHFSFFARALWEVTKPGRLTCCHLAQVSSTKATHGVIGLIDLRGPVIETFVKAGWVYHGDITIDRNPQAQAIRTHALRNGTPVLTPHGWRPIDALTTGDYVVGSDGHPVRVTGVFPQGMRDLFEVMFSDGATITCDAGHLWAVKTDWMRYRKREPRVLSLSEIMADGVRQTNGKYRHEIPVVGPIQFAPSHKPLPLEPYLLGVLLGDGSMTQRSTVLLTTRDAVVKQLTLPDGVRLNTYRRRGHSATYGLVADGRYNPILDALRELALVGWPAWLKFIPLPYLFSSTEDRRKLLQGLLDTDGTCTASGHVRYTTTSERLAHDVLHLVRSLGGIATSRINRNRYRLRDTVKLGRPAWTLYLRLDPTTIPFRSDDKAARWLRRRSSHRWRRHISSIRPAVPGDATCITVDAQDGLFVAEHFIVTHNSKALLFVQLKKDASWLRPALADYMLVFRKPGENAVPIKPDITNDDWIEWARPIWFGIRESDTLQFRGARGTDDGRHLCPLQLPVIERCIRLWSNRGETVLSPFMGIGSEGWQAIRLGRRFVGIELKGEYFNAAIATLRRAEVEAEAQGDLFVKSQGDGMAVPDA